MDPVENVPNQFATIAVIDLETCNLPMHNHNKTAITELCIYGFAANLLKKEQNGRMAKKPEIKNSIVPATPRILHKLTLLMNPNMMVDPGTENITGLNNYILEHESTFDENAAETMLGFLRHLQQPICLVAHNGWSFDFPIVKMSLEKLKKHLPDNMVCVDSLRAFLEIDRKREKNSSKLQTLDESLNVLEKTPTKSFSSTELLDDAAPNVLETTPMKSFNSTELLDDATPNVSETTPMKSFSSTELLDYAASENSQFNWREFNETTPKRRLTSIATNAAKRKLLSNYNVEPSKDDCVEVSLQAEATSVKTSQNFKSKRSLNFGADASPVFKKYPPRGVYRLEPMYKRVFNTNSVNAHHAEADVKMLMNLILHYGEDFLAYAEQHAKPLSDVPALGRY